MPAPVCPDLRTSRSLHDANVLGVRPPGGFRGGAYPRISLFQRGLRGLGRGLPHHPADLRPILPYPYKVSGANQEAVPTAREASINHRTVRAGRAGVNQETP